MKLLIKLKIYLCIYDNGKNSMKKVLIGKNKCGDKDGKRKKKQVFMMRNTTLTNKIYSKGNYLISAP